MKMKRKKYDRINASWELAEETFGDDKSTEFLIQWVADDANVEHDDVMAYLEQKNRRTKR